MHSPLVFSPSNHYAMNLHHSQHAFTRVYVNFIPSFCRQYHQSIGKRNGNPNRIKQNTKHRIPCLRFINYVTFNVYADVAREISLVRKIFLQGRTFLSCRIIIRNHLQSSYHHQTREMFTFSCSSQRESKH